MPSAAGRTPAKDMAIEAQAQLLDLVADAVVVRDLAGIVRYWNRGAEVLYGWRKAEATGRRIQELLQSSYPRPLAEIETQIFRDGYWEGEIGHVRRDGNKLIVNGRWALQRDAQGEPAGILESNTDITIRRRDEEALRRSEAKFRLLLEAAPDAMIVFDAAGRAALANRQAEEIFGFGPGELRGQEVEALMPGRFRDAHSRHRAAYIREPRARPMGAGLDLFALKKDGTEMPVEISLSPVRLGEELVVIAAVRDISVRKRAAAEMARLHALELAQAEHLATLGEIAAGLAHEIKNPLAGIAAALEVLGGHYESDQEVMAEVQAQVQRIRGIVDDLLHYARPRSLQMENGNINVPVTRAVHLAAHAATRRSVRVVFTPSPVPALPHDPEQVERMVANLALNAVEAAPEAGHVEITTSVVSGSPARIAIQVRDNGAGIAPDVLPRIFRPFFTTKGDRGNGLGLPLCRRIAELHQGTIEVESQLGHGAVFTVLLPVAASPANP